MDQKSGHRGGSAEFSADTIRLKLEDSQAVSAVGGSVEESTSKLIQVIGRSDFTRRSLHLKSQHRCALMLQISLISFSAVSAF